MPSKPKYEKSMPPIKDRTGKRYGRLLVIEQAQDGPPSSRPKWRCLCDCGKIVVRNAASLALEHQIHSCGCYQREQIIQGNKLRGKIKFPNPVSYTATYKCWRRMKERCLNPKHDQYSNYGGRGISVCKEWMKFENFLSDMGQRPTGMTIERIDNSKGYYKHNCKWATMVEQQSNKRNNQFLTLGQDRLTVAQWSRKLGVNDSTIRERIRRNWDIASSLTKPSHEKEIQRIQKSSM